jgi:hypothetical protein
LKIKGKSKKIKAMIKLTSKNYLKDNGVYYKIIFDDGAFLLIIPEEKEFYYEDKIIEHINEIKDEQIGRDKLIEYMGKSYELGNRDDYQFVLELLVGSPLEIEGECSFSDYFPTTGPKEFLSLGWLSLTGKRADINPKIISLEEIEIVI